jgi:hypothetical protein
LEESGIGSVILELLSRNDQSAGVIQAGVGWIVPGRMIE